MVIKIIVDLSRMHILNMHEVKENEEIYVYIDIDHNVAPLQIKISKCYVYKSNDVSRFHQNKIFFKQ